MRDCRPGERFGEAYCVPVTNWANVTIGYAVSMDKYDCVTGESLGFPGHWCDQSGFWHPTRGECEVTAAGCNAGVGEEGFSCAEQKENERCNGIDDDCDGQIDEDVCPAGPPECGGQDPLCVGDPVFLDKGFTFHTIKDASLSTAAGEVTLRRTYFSSEINSRALDSRDEFLDLGPRPFGTSANIPAPGMRWWHSFYSFVVEGIPGEEGDSVRVFTPEGHWLTFARCQGASCWAGHPQGSTQRERLHVQTGSQAVYTLHFEDGRRFEYSSRFIGSRGEVSLFLSRLYTPKGELLAEVDYALPVLDGEPCPGCADCQGQNGGCQTSCTEGTPYVSKVRAASGAEFRFQYLRAAYRQECVLSSVGVAPGTDDEETPVVTYEYEQASDGVVPGILAAAHWPSATGEEVERYESGSDFFRITNAKGEVVHRYNESHGATAVSGDDHDLLIEYFEDGSRTVIDRSHRTPEGAQTEIQRVFEIKTINRPYPGLVTESCSDERMCVPGTEERRWLGGANGPLRHERARKDKAGHWTVNTMLPSSNPATPGQTELLQKDWGAVNEDGADSLVWESYEYAYGSNDRQLLSKRWGRGPRTEYAYDDANLLTKELRTGNTTTADGEEIELAIARYFLWSPEAPCRATEGEVLEVHGPCIDGEDGCRDAVHPVTQYVYSRNAATGAREQLRAVARFPEGCGGRVLETRYPSYDAFGNVLETVDPNGASIAFEWDGPRHRLLARTEGGKRTEYRWENGSLRSVHHPDGSYEVSCHREGEACDGAWSGKLRWRVTSQDEEGRQWSRKTTYDYWPNGAVKEERLFTCESAGCPGDLRQVKRYAYDAYQQVIQEDLGVAPGDPIRSPVRTVTRWDHAGNLAARLSPYVVAGIGQDGCENGGRECSRIAHDRADRPQSVTTFASAGSGTRSCLKYDEQGNVSALGLGCSADADCERIDETCASHVDYTYDSFGNLLSASLPGGGLITYAYDAAGNLVGQASPTMADAGERYEYRVDQLGRRLEELLIGPEGTTVLAKHGYDDGGPAACATLANTRGRLRWLEDGFGRTWYSYDAAGRVTKELRLRAGRSCTDGLPDSVLTTNYEYTAGGHLSAIGYPHGRRVEYRYHSDLGRNGQVASVWINDGVSATASTPVVDKISWGARGELLAYELVGSGARVAVEYLYGGDSQSAGSDTCTGLTRPSGANDGSGLLRGLWVSRGSLSGNRGGELLKRVMSYQGDQLVLQDSCFLGETGKTRREDLRGGYDWAGRLVKAQGGKNGGGALFSERRYEFGLTGDRSAEWQDGVKFVWDSDGSSSPEQLALRRKEALGTMDELHFEYDGDGRVTRLFGAQDSTGDGPTLLDLQYAPNGAPDTRMSAVVVPGEGTYRYAYDASRRRRLKQLPDGDTQEFFWDLGHRLLEDRGPRNQEGVYPLDEYLWLGDRPIAFLRSRLSHQASSPAIGTATRLGTRMAEADGTQVCSWKSERGGCGLHFIVSDDLTRPVLVLDSALRVSAINEFDPYGHANRQSLHVESEHPYAPGESTVLGRCDLKAGPGEEVETRVLFAQVDTEGVGRDYVRLESLGGAAIPGSEIGGPASGRTWTPWVDEDQVQMRFLSSMDACCAESCDDSCDYAGVVAEACEFRRYQKGSGVIPMSVPLRFPGQYHDRESELFENWYRYYEPNIGNYLQPEPLTQAPKSIKDELSAAREVTHYRYSLSNPEFFVDLTGAKVAARDGCAKEVKGLLQEMEKALKNMNTSGADCRCKQLLSDFKLFDAFSKQELIEVICYSDKIKDGGDECGYGGRENEIDISTRPGCRPLSWRIAHELGHVAGEREHEPDDGNFNTPKPQLRQFERMSRCFNENGSLRDSPAPPPDIFLD